MQPNETQDRAVHRTEVYGNDREGVVIRYDSGIDPMPAALHGMSNMWSFKVVNDDYLLK